MVPISKAVAMSRFLNAAGLMLGAVLCLAASSSRAAETPEEQRQRLSREIEEMQRTIMERNREIEQRAIDQQREAELQARQREERQRRENAILNGGPSVIILDGNNGTGTRPSAPFYGGNNGTVIIGQPTQAQQPVWVEPVIPGVDRGQILMRGQYWAQPDYNCQVQRWMDDRAQLVQRWVCP
jgi:TolA-binding protein